MRIGTVEISNPVGLAPMAGVTDLPFRTLCKELGCGLLYTEMVSAKAILYKNKNTKPLMETTPDESPIALQLFGSDPDIMADIAAQVAEETSFDIIDVNMGCPVPKIVGNHEGSALMKEPKLVEAILTAMVKKLKKPLTIKIRKGFNDESVNAVEIAKIAEACGVSAVAVHGRTREEYYSGVADYDIIAQVKKAVSIPIFGNGDVRCVEDAKRLYEATGCDGILIGRGARGNPWIFREISEYYKTGVIPKRPSQEEVLDMIMRHGILLVECKGEYTGIREMRKHVAWYTAGMPHSAAIRNQVNQIETMSGLRELLGNLTL